MVQSPVSPSPFDKVLKVVAAVKTNIGLAGINLILLFLAFFLVLLLTNGRDRLILGLVVFIGWMLFAVYAVRESATKQREPLGNSKK